MEMSTPIHQSWITYLSLITIILSLIVTLYTIFSNSKKYNYPPITTVFNKKIILYNKGLYARNSVSGASQAIAQDYITLFIALPILMTSLFIANRSNSLKGYFILTGTTLYFLYTYISYSFLLIFNKLFLLYVILMSVNFYNFILCLSYLHKFILPLSFVESFPSKIMIILMFWIGAILLGMWLGRIIPFNTRNKIPEGLDNYSTLVIQAWDIGFVIPSCFITGIWIYYHNYWGIIFSIILMTKAITWGSAISAMVVNMTWNGVKTTWWEKLLFPIITTIGIQFIKYILGNINESEVRFK